MMINQSVMIMPWAFHNSGIVLGIVICIVTFLFSMRATLISIRIVPPMSDYYDTMYKYWGPIGYLICVVGTLVIMLTACTGYFIIMT